MLLEAVPRRSVSAANNEFCKPEPLGWRNALQSGPMGHARTPSMAKDMHSFCCLRRISDSASAAARNRDGWDTCQHPHWEELHEQHAVESWALHEGVLQLQPKSAFAYPHS
jgi:hypothetical protein